jgi:hypothetical protein
VSAETQEDQEVHHVDPAFAAALPHRAILLNSCMLDSAEYLLVKLLASMATSLLKNNSRAAAALVAAACLPIILGLLLVWWAQPRQGAIITVLAWSSVAAGLILTCRQLLWLRTPRLACTPDELLVFLRGRQPIRVPIDLVECFFLGQAASRIVTPAGPSLETRTVVVRLAERARRWHQRPVRRVLGRWCDGYIVIRGMWCEPISPELVNRMNAKLTEIKRHKKENPL